MTLRNIISTTLAAQAPELSDEKRERVVRALASAVERRTKSCENWNSSQDQDTERG